MAGQPCMEWIPIKKKIKFELRPILVKLSFREFWDSKLSGLHAFGNMAISFWLVGQWDISAYILV